MFMLLCSYYVVMLCCLHMVTHNNEISCVLHLHDLAVMSLCHRYVTSEPGVNLIKLSQV